MKIKPGFELRNICGYHMVIAFGEENVNFSNVIQMNDSAAFLWKKMAPLDFDTATMARALMEEYEVDEPTALADVEKIAQQWKDAGLIEDDANPT